MTSKNSKSRLEFSTAVLVISIPLFETSFGLVLVDSAFHPNAYTSEVETMGWITGDSNVESKFI